MEFREPKLWDKKPTYCDPPRTAMNTTQKHHVIPDTLVTFDDSKSHMDYHQHEGQLPRYSDIPKEAFEVSSSGAILKTNYNLTEEGKKRMQECLKDLNL